LIISSAALELNVCASGLAFKLRLASLASAALLPALLPAAAVAEFQNDTSTFSGEVATTCAFSDLQSSYNLRNLVYSHDNIPLLMSYANTFYVTSNSAVRLSIEYSIVDEPAGFVPSSRYANLRQRIGGIYQTPEYARSPNEALTPMSIDETPGTAAAAILMYVKPATMPGNYEYQVTITCLL